jgi:hypothetical protein
MSTRYLLYPHLVSSVLGPLQISVLLSDAITHLAGFAVESRLELQAIESWACRIVLFEDIYFIGNKSTSIAINALVGAVF